MPVERAYALVDRALFRRAPRIYRVLYSLYKRFGEAGEWRLLNLIVRPGMTVVDVGSNIGIYTALFTRLAGAGGVVHSFEPDPENFARLEDACGGAPNVRLNRAAVAARSETLRLFRSPDLNVDHRTYQCGTGRESVEVAAIALDDYFVPGDRVDFVKIDIQGFELHALSGMNRVIEENDRLAMLLEYFPAGITQAGGTPEALLALLRGAGFALHAISAAGRLRALGGEAPPLGRLGYTNIFACRRMPAGV